MKKPFFILLTLILLAAACNSHEQTVVEPTTTNWQTYTDHEHAFQFQYQQTSNSYVVTDGRSTGLIFSIEKDGVEAMYGTFTHENRTVTNMCSSSEKNIGTITIAGQVVNRCYTAMPAFWTAILQRKTTNGVDVFKITCSNEHNDFETYCEKVLASFAFTN